MIYECHITCDVKDAAIATEVARIDNWKTSEIARDPTLGNKNFFYLTCHERDVEKIFLRMRAVVRALRHLKVEVLREKIELIIYDTKFSKPIKPLSESVEQTST